MATTASAEMSALYLGGESFTKVLAASLPPFAVLVTRGYSVAVTSI